MAGGKDKELLDAVDWFAPCADMPQAVKSEATRKLKRRLAAWAPRVVGLLLLAILLARLDLGQVSQAIRKADLLLVTASVLLVMPLILIKTVRWQGILRSQSVQFPTWPAFLAYFGSLFVGFLTPGRLGEFVKALHVSQDCGMSTARAFSTVLADRLFDLYALLLVGGAALLTLTADPDVNGALGLIGFTVLPTLPLVMLLNARAFGWLQAFGLRFGSWGQKLFAPQGWLMQLRKGLLELTLPWLVRAAGLTVFAYGIFFSQCYLLAIALRLSIGYAQVSYAVALGSLVTLLPVSISGLGTREAAIIAYLGTAGVPVEAALAFSLLVFVTSYVAGGLMGAIAWWMKPVPLTREPLPASTAPTKVSEPKH